MAVFNPITYDNYIANSDYIGLAKYIEEFIPDVTDENQRIALMNNVSSLRRFGGIANRILQAEIPEEDKDLFMFNAQKNYGVVNAGNSIYQKYDEYKKNIGAKSHWFKPDDIASSIGYMFDNDETYNDFINKSGIVVDSTQNVTKRYIDGKPVLHIGKTAFQDDTFFDSVTKSLDQYVQPMGFYVGPGGFPVPQEPLFRTIGFNEKGEKISDISGFDDNQKAALDLLQKSDVVFDKYYTQQYNKEVPSDLMVSGFMCGAEKQLTDKLFNQQIDPTTYNAYRKVIKDYYDNQLAHISLTKQSEVYMTEPGNTSQLLNPLNDEQKGEWTRFLRIAIKEGRTSYAAGAAGGRVGTVITISDKPISNELNQEDYSEGVQIFVPGLFDEDARAMINEDDNARLMVELAEHQAFGHDYDLVEGGKLKNFDGDGGAWFEDDNILQYRTPEEVYSMMKRNILIDGGIQAAKSMLQKDNNGNISNASELLSLVETYSINVFSDLNDIESQEDLDNILNNPAAAKDIENIFILILRELGLDRLGNPVK